ncbi:MAG: amidohydrolase family protein [Phycisphaeraceae bacterium]|nr:amidohydrolase family protein [Phycisphaeraceae bacterium]
MSIIAAAASLLISASHGQDLTIKAPPQRAPIAIINAAIHPVGRDEIGHGYIVFDKGVITDIGQGEAPSLPDGTEVIDAQGLRVYPGLFSPWTQLGLTEIQSVLPSTDLSENGRVTPEARAVTAVNPDSTLIPVTRSNGVLSALIFPSGGLVSGQASVIRLEGWTNTEMTVEPSAGVVVSWPNMRTVRAWWMDQSDEDQQRTIRRDIDLLDQVFETARAYALAKEAEPATPTDLRWEAMRPVFGTRTVTGETSPPSRPVYVRANDTEQITAAVAFGEKHALRLVIVGGRDADQCRAILKERDIPVIVMGTHVLPKRDDSAYDEPFTLPARLHAAGLRFSIAHTDDTAHERNLPYNAATAVAYGLDHDTALRSITQWSAEIAGVGDRLGTLDVGKHATLIITNGSPLEITTRISAAYIDGRRIDLTNKHTHLAEKYRERYRQQDTEAP